MTQHQQQEYIIKENQLVALSSPRFSVALLGEIAEAIRSRPAPAAPRICSLGVESSKCNTFPECSDCMTYHNAASTIRNQTLDEKAAALKEMETLATSRYESATSKNEEVYQQGIAMGLQMAIQSLRTPSTQEHQRGDH